MDIILGVRYCPVAKMTLCVTSEPEMDKCIKMKVNNKFKIYLFLFYKLVINFLFVGNSWH